MKKYLSSLLFTLALATNIIVMPATTQLTVATYNVMHGLKGNWPQRQQGVCDLIARMNADIYGFQEVIKDNNQLAAIEKTLSDYSYVGQPRSMGVKGISLWHRLINLATRLNWIGIPLGDEYNPIFYHKNKMDLLDHGTFGINNTGWRSTLVPRICTWALFKETATNKDLYIYNTHLDNKNQSIRIKQIKLILDDITQRCGTTPVILMGDLNTTFADDMETTLSDANFIQGRHVAKATEGPITTHLKGKPFEIDHILFRPKENFDVKNYKIFDSISSSTSDHNPVSMTFLLN